MHQGEKIPSRCGARLYLRSDTCILLRMWSFLHSVWTNMNSWKFAILTGLRTRRLHTILASAFMCCINLDEPWTSIFIPHRMKSFTSESKFYLQTEAKLNDESSARSDNWYLEEANLVVYLHIYIQLNQNSAVTPVLQGYSWVSPLCPPIGATVHIKLQVLAESKK